MIEGNVFTVSEVSAFLRVSEKTVYRLVRDNELRGIWVRGQIRITSQALQNYLEGGNDG